MTTTNSRFIGRSFLKSQQVYHNPLFDYAKLPILTLEEAVQNLVHLVPGVSDHVQTAKRECNRDSILLTQDESAAIYLYTMPVVSFFSRLNTVLQTKIQHDLKPWLAFLKIFITALEKLPSSKDVVWRGVNYDASSELVQDEVYNWWGFSSCSMNINSIRSLLGESGTLFAIQATHSKDISTFSAIPDEQEVILMPGTRLRVRSQPLDPIGCHFVVHLEEINPQR